MAEVLLIGIGSGHPDHLTLEAVAAIRRVDVFFTMDKGSDRHDLRAFRDAVCHRHRPDGGYRTIRLQDPPRDRAPLDYEAAVREWHVRRAGVCREVLGAELATDQVGAFLVWGEPSLFDSTLRFVSEAIADRADVSLQVLPGISSVQVLTARHAIPLNRVGLAVHITTGRRLAAGDVPADADLVVLLDGETAFTTLPPDDHIYWGAYLGTPDEILVAGRVGDVSERLLEVRARAREAHGWIMDTYLVRRAGP